MGKKLLWIIGLSVLAQLFAFVVTSLWLKLDTTGDYGLAGGVIMYSIYIGTTLVTTLIGGTVLILNQKKDRLVTIALVILLFIISHMCAATVFYTYVQYKMDDVLQNDQIFIID